MKTTTPFLTGFSTLICGRSKASAQAVLSEKRKQLLDVNIDITQQFADEISPELLDQSSCTERVRDYPDTLVFWAFLHQIASDDASCAHAVAQVQEWTRLQGLPVPSANTASYCNARARLPIDMLRKVHRSLCEQLDANLPVSRRWRGLRPLVEDGTSAQMPDTQANRKIWHYASGQSEGCGFPVIKLNGLIDLSHGGIRDFAFSSLNVSELRAHERLQESYIAKDDLLIADRLYSSYEVIARLRQCGAHYIGRPHQSRKVDYRKGQKVSRNERIVEWKKSRYAPKGSQLSQAEWEALPDILKMRIVRYKGPDRDGNMKTRYVVTTLLESREYPADEVISLYVHRWEIEVRFREIKSTLGMEMLRTKSPEMISKEILMYMIFYNLIRLLMLKAGLRHGVNHRRLSFRGVQQSMQASRAGFRNVGGHPVLRGREKVAMWERVAERIVVERPGRNEPRRVKRRPKCTRWLQKPRHEYFEHFRSDEAPMKSLDNAA